MILIIALVLLGVWAIVQTAVELRRDGHRRIPTDWSRVPAQDAADARRS